ncbi:MAG: dipeptidase [Actinomycetota bacterium]
MTGADDRVPELLRSAPLIDGHNDLPWALREAREDGRAPDIAQACPDLQTDLPRIAAGGLGGQFWSVYVPSDLPPDLAVTQTLEQVDSVYQLVARHSDRLQLARSADDVERLASTPRLASMIGVEGGHSMGGSLGTLRILARLGAGYLTLTHNDDTPWADSATGDHPHGGLTTFGEEVVHELNRCGVLVDLSHTSDDTMRQAIHLSEAPVIFSHSSARALCDVTRNVPDDVLELVGRRGGVVMVSFVPSFTTRQGAVANQSAWADVQRLRVEHRDEPEVLRAAVDARFADEEGEVTATIGDVADHVDHVRAVAGIDAVGIGSDFDGAGRMPLGLEDVSCYPALFAELAARSYTDEELQKVAGRNVLRVMREAERVAAGLRPAGRVPSASPTEAEAQ